MKSSKWNIDKVKEVALNYNTKKEFLRNASGAYKWAWKNKCIEEVCSHMKPFTKPKGKYNLENVQELVLKYKTRTTFRKEEGGAYDWARRNNYLDFVCNHMEPLIRYNLSKVKSIAIKFSNRVEFLESNEGAYRWAQRNNKLDLVCSHMDYIRSYWDESSVVEEAQKYDSRKEFQKEAVGAYEWALRNNCLDSVCKHMKIKGHKYKRALYVYEFENKSAYIGLTFDYEKRHSEHLRRGPVFKESKKSKAKFIKLDNWMAASKSRIAERELIEKYRKNGWHILNVAAAGSLGGNDIKWNDMALLKEAKKHKTVKEFRDKSPSAYATAHQKGFSKFASHLKYERKTWNLKSVIIEAKKYRNRTDFMRLSPGAYDWCRNNNQLAVACKHMKPMRNSWNFEKVLKEVSKYASRTEFQRNSGSAYMWAQRNNLLEEVYTNLNKSL